ncbi:HTH-type transcriptional repressor Bm3R1 [Sebaldella termitidis]|uniref:Transcriptional regulator, TetR family n=2 Tax=Sebaldella TaxID=32068 RepID=D1AL20_SEBTE|nr:TetR/AcrR family transcriptional regulator [Sebaldella termitidis]ACZ09163.1 transcriptional regulator, TetR family [Sebaldella termitidis ATCC 33386]SUI24481.1 HTH-type transcriptional repressor Bm3R1 [Sebaldella termitidis]
MEFLHTKEKILTGMLRLIWEVGLEKSSIALLSQKIKISPGNIYYYFRGKEEIINSLCFYCSDLLSSAIKPKEYEAFYDNCSIEILEREFKSFITKMIIFYKNNPHIINYITVINGSSYIKQEMKKKIRLEKDIYWKFLEKLKENKAIKDVSTSILISFITSVMHDMVVQDVVLNNLTLDDKKIDALFNLIWSGLSSE